MARMLEIVSRGRLSHRWALCVALIAALTFAGATVALGEPAYPPPVQGDTYRVLKTIALNNGGSAQVQDFAFDLQGNLWVIEDGLQTLPRLVKYDEFGLVAATYTNLGLRQPTALAFGPDGMLYITDANVAYSRWYGDWGTMPADGRVVVVNPSTGAYVGQKPDFSQPGPPTLSTIDEAPLNLRYPSDIEFDENGNAYICDFAYNRISVFSPGWEPVTRFGNVVPQYGDGRFMHPWGIDIAPDGALWVADFYNDRIHRMTTDGEFLATYGPEFPDWVPNEYEADIMASVAVISPLDVTVDEHNVAYVVDAQTYWPTFGIGRFFRVSEAGEFLGYYGATHGEESVGFPSRVRVDHDGSVWINDEGFFGDAPGIHMYGLNAGEPDLVPPVTTSSYNGEWTNANPLSVTLNAVDASTTVAATFYSLDGTDPTVRYEGPISVSEEGTRTLKFRSVDRVGNVEDIKSQLLKIDHTPPSSWSSVVPTYYGSTFVYFGATDALSGAQQTYWRLDDAAPQIGTFAPVTFNPARQFRKLEYYSMDQAGNIEPPNTVFFWVLPTDDNPPETTWVERSNNWFTSNTQITLNAVDDVSGVEATYLQVNGGEWTTYTAPVPVTQEGTHTLAYYSVDTVGKRETTKTGTIRLDKTKPSTSATWTIGSIGTATVHFTATDAISGVQRIDWRITTGPQGTVMPDFANTPTAFLPTHGNYTIAYRAYDWAGNLEDVKYAYVTVIAPDYEPPVTISSIPQSGWIRGPHELVLTASDGGGSGVRDTFLSVDGGPWIDYVPGAHVFPQGVYDIRWYSVDTQDNAEAVKSATLRVDETPPTVSTNAQPFYAGYATVSLNAADPQSGAVPWFRLDGGPPQAGFTVNLNDYRTFSLQYWAVNGAGLESTRTTIQIQVNPPDSVPPVTTFTGPGGWQKGFAAFSLSAVDEHSSVLKTEYTLNGSNPIFYTGGLVTVSGEGTTTIGYFSTDIYNNREATKTATVLVDSSPPVTTSDAVSTYTDQAVIKLTPTDAYSGVGQTYYRVNGGTWQTGTDVLVNWSRTRKNHTVDYYSVDAVGNIESVKSVTFEIRLNPIPYQWNDSRLVYRGAWAPAFSNDVAAANSNGSFVFIAFQGTRLDLSARKGPDMGILRASVLDTDLAPVMVDLYHPANLNGSYSPPAWTTGDLEYGDYIVKLEWTGTKNPSSSGTSINVDEIRIEGVLTQVFDEAAPVTTHEAPSAWTKGPAVVTLASTDTTTGVKGIYATSDGSTPTVSTPYTGPLTITAQGLTTVRYFAVDNRGNVESLKSVTVRVDDLAPVTNSNVASSYITTSTINLYPNDLPNQGTSDNSGIASTRWRLDGGAWTTGTAVPVAGTALGTHTLEWFSVDKLGNTEATKSATFTVMRRFEESNPAIYYRGFWSYAPNTSRSAGGWLYTNNAGGTGAVAHLRFSGTAIRLIGSKQNNYGIARLVVDGVAHEADFYSVNAIHNQTIATVSGLTDGVHDVRIEWTGTKNPASLGTGMGVDAVDVVGTLIADTAAPVTTVSAPGAWVSNPATVTLSATEDHTWLTGTYYSVNGSAPVTYTAPFTISADGQHTVAYWSVDAAGNVEPTRTAVVRIDRTAPTSAITAPEGWTAGDVDVAIDAVDAHSGVATILYSTDGTDPQTVYTGPFTVSAEGTTTVRYRSIDAVGNTEAVRTATVRIDRTAPVVTAVAPEGWIADNAVVALGATDAGAGVEAILYSTDGTEPSLPTTGQVTVSAEGTTTVRYCALDALGNRSATAAVTVRVDKTAPVTTSNAVASYNGTATVTLTATDAHSGVARTEYRLNGGAWTTGATVVVNTGGTHTLQWRSVDAAGKVEEPKSATFTVANVRREDNDPRIALEGPWITSLNASRSGGSWSFVNTTGSKAIITFKGTAIDLYGSLAPTQGRGMVVVDGNTTATVEFYSPGWIHNTKVWGISGLQDTTHTVELRWTGTKHPSSTGTGIGLDAVVMTGDLMQSLMRYEETDARLTWHGQWNSAENTKRSAGAWRFTNTQESAMNISFRGTGLDLFGSTSPNYGIARVKVNGTATQTVDFYTTGYLHNVKLWSVSGLPYGDHVVTIEWTGTKHPASTGTGIGVDAFDVRGGIRQAPPAGPVLTRFEENNTRMVREGTWSAAANDKRSAGSWLYSNAPDSAYYIRFTGTRLDLIGSLAPNYGIARVTVDGTRVSTADFYSSGFLHNQKVWSINGLDNAEHTVVIEWTGTKNPASTGTGIGVDAIDIDGQLLQASLPGPALVRYEETAPEINWTGSWLSAASASRSGGAWMYTNADGSKATVRFTGTKVDLIVSVAPTYGIAKVTLDGKVHMVDLYSPSFINRLNVWSSGKLVNAEHLLTIEWTGTKNAASSGTGIGIDALDINGALVP